MRSLAAPALALAVALAGAPSATWAQGNPHDPPQPWSGPHDGPDRQDRDPHHQESPDRGDRRDDRGHEHHRDHGDRGAPHWVRGQPLPPAYRGPSHAVPPGWFVNHHPAPPRHHWARVGADAVLVVSASGIVVDVVIGAFH